MSAIMHNNSTQTQFIVKSLPLNNVIIGWAVPSLGALGKRMCKAEYGSPAGNSWVCHCA